MKIVRWFALAVVVGGLTVLSPSAGAGEPASIPYTCSETTTEPLGLPAFAADVTLTGSAQPATPKIFQPVTWTFDLQEPDLAPPVPVALHFLRVRLPIPEGLANVAARVVAAPGETPNPAVSAISVQTTTDEVIVQLPASPANTTRIRAATDGTLTYPYSELNPFFVPAAVVLPQVRVTATPTPAAGGSTIQWRAPEIDSRATASALGGEPDVGCVADGDPDPTVVSTDVLATRQLCDGKPVTVQLGFNSPTAAANVIQGTAANDTANGLGGNDRFCGLAGMDTFNGGAGNDRALGGAGNDRLRGDAGDDRLQGDAGNDNLQGGANRDTLVGGANRDTCNGGPQRDTATTCEVRQSIP